MLDPKIIASWPLCECGCGLRVAPDGLKGIQAGARISKTARIRDGARIGSRARVGDGASIGARARIKPRASIGADGHIGDSARVGWLVSIEDGASIGAGTRIGDGAHIGRGAHIGGGAHIGDMADIGDGANIGASARIRHGARVIIVRPIGSRGDVLTLYRDERDGSIRCSTGCVIGLEAEEFLHWVTCRHGDNEHAVAYRAFVTAGIAALSGKQEI